MIASEKISWQWTHQVAWAAGFNLHALTNAVPDAEHTMRGFMWARLMFGASVRNVARLEEYVLVCARRGGRLDLMNAIMAIHWMDDMQKEFVKAPYPTDEIARYAALVTETSRHSMIQLRALIPEFPAATWDKHTAVARHDTRPQLQLELEACAREGIPVELKDMERSHPDRAKLAHQFTTEFFVREGTRLHDPHPLEWRFHGEAVEVYVASAKAGKDRARDCYKDAMEYAFRYSPANVAPSVKRARQEEELGLGQKRTGRHKKFVKIRRGADEIYKGPYNLGEALRVMAIGAGLRKIARRFFLRHNYLEKREDGFYLVSENLASAPADDWVGKSWTEAVSMGGRAFLIWDRASMGIRTGVEVMDAEPDTFEKLFRNGLYDALLALFVAGVGDVQLGSNFLVTPSAHVFVDYEDRRSGNQETLLKAPMRRDRQDRFDRLVQALKDTGYLTCALERIGEVFRSPEAVARINMLKA